jgi:signal transduction histidine kinase/CHASE2 domain-containing sensor protein
MIWRIGELGWRLLPGGLVSLAFAILLNVGVLQPLEQIAYTTLFRARGERSWDSRLVMVAIDDASIRRLGRFPWTRQRYVKLLNVLTEADPSLVVFNLIWSESSPDDPALAKAITRSGRVVLAQGVDNTGLPLLPVPDLQASAIASGHILKQQDTDGLTRKIDLYHHGEPSLGFSVIRAYTLVQASVPLPRLNRPLWVNWMGQAQTLPRYSFIDVIEGKVPVQSLEDKIVLVGVTAAGIDPLPTPYDRNPPASGVYLQATVINNLLQQNSLHPPALAWFILILLIAGPGLSLLLSYQRKERQVLIWVAFCVGWCVLAFSLFLATYWLPLAFPLCLMTTTAGATFVSTRLRMGALLRQQVQQLWQLYRQDLVVPPNSGLSARPLLQPTSSVQSAAQLAALADQLGRSQATQAAIARSLSIGLVAADWDGLVWFANPVASDWLSVQVGDDLMTCLVPLWLTEEEWQTDFQTLRWQGSVPPHELQQGDRWYALKLEPLNYGSSQSWATPSPPLDGLLMVLEDITTQKQAEAALERQVSELQRVAQLKDDFLSTVSHELRSPMANMKMAIELLKIARSSEASQRYLTILENECTREIELIDDLLDLQRLEVGAQAAHFSEIDLENWLPPIFAPFYERTENQQQTLRVELSTPLPPLVSDRASLERVVVELLNNACKYTPSGETIQVTVRTCPATPETGQATDGQRLPLPPAESSLPSTLSELPAPAQSLLQFSITNTGTEIPEEELPRIFEKFYRIPNADPWRRGGTGLGLALVKKLVESLGGTIQVSSGSGQTCFTVYLPLER